MGIDLERKKRGRRKNTNRTTPLSKNVYLNLTVKLYRFLSRRTESAFNKVILKRLYMSRMNRPPISISRLARHIKKGQKEDKIAVIVGTVTDDSRLLKDVLPKIKVCALRVTEKAREKIIQAGGEVLTFDQLALRAPTGKNCLLLRGPRVRHRACVITDREKK